MINTIADAKGLLVELQRALGQKGTERVADSVLLLPKTEHVIAQLLRCVEFLSRKTNEPREELAKSVSLLRSEVWRINDAVAKATGFQEQMGIPVAPLSVALRRALAALDQIEMLLPKECDHE